MRIYIINYFIFDAIVKGKIKYQFLMCETVACCAGASRICIIKINRFGSYMLYFLLYVKILER